MPSNKAFVSFDDRLNSTIQQPKKFQSELERNVEAGIDRAFNPKRLYEYNRTESGLLRKKRATSHEKEQNSRSNQRCRKELIAQPSALSASLPPSHSKVSVEDDRDVELTRMIERASKRSHKLADTESVAPNESVWLRQLQTGEDAVAFFAAHGTKTAVKSIVLNLAPTQLEFQPYKLLVVQRKGEVMPEHYVMSANSIVYVCPRCPTEVITLADWMRESSLFNMLRRIPFFKNYLIYKALFLLYHANRNKKFASARRSFGQNSLMLKRTFVSSTLGLLRSSETLTSTPLIAYEAQGKHDYLIDEFHTFQSQHQSHVTTLLNSTLSQMESALYEFVKFLHQRADVPNLNTQQALEQYLRSSDLPVAKSNTELVNDILSNPINQNTFNINSDNISSSSMNIDNTMVVVDNARSRRRMISMREARYAQERKMQELKRSIVEFGLVNVYIRMCDLITSENLMRNALLSIENFLNTIRRQNMEEVRIVGFQILLEPTSEKMMYNPDELLIQRACADVYSACLDVVSHLGRLCERKVFLTHFARQPRTWNITATFKSDARLRYLFKATAALLHDDYSLAHTRMITYAATLPHIHFLQRDWTDIVQQWRSDMKEEKNERMSCLSLAKLYRRLHEAHDALRVLMASFVGHTLWINAAKLKTEIEPRMHILRSEVDATLRETTRTVIRELNSYFKQKTLSLNERPSSLEAFSEYVSAYKSIIAELAQTDVAVSEAEALCELMDRQGVEFDNDADRQLKERTVGNGITSAMSMHALFDEARLHAEEFIEKQIGEHAQQLQDEINNTEDESIGLQQLLEGNEFVMLADDVEPILQYLQDVHNKLADVQQSEAKLTRFAELLDLPPCDWTCIREVEVLYEVRQELWSLLDELNRKMEYWLECPLKDLDTMAMEDEVNAMIRRVGIIARSVQDKGYDDDVGEFIINELQTLRQNMSTIHDCGNHHMTAEHWNVVLQEVTNGSFAYYDGLNLRALQEHNIFNFKDVLMEQSGLATGEWKINNDLDEIRQVWNKMAFTTKPYKNRDSVFILDELDDINQQLDDHQIELQTIMASRFVAPVRERVENWLRELRRIADVIEEWVTLQKNWMYLEFIFSSEDIKEQLPTESDQFDAVDRLFRGLTNRANTIGNVYKICTENDVLEELHRSNADIDHIQKKLEDYLETKRVAFPRFYFLSNDELLSILSDVRNPKAVQPHLQKCFDSIAALVFADAACTEIAGMQSPEGEKVDFESPVYPIGNVEQWLTEIESMMKASLLMHTKSTIDEYSPSRREKWFFEHPAQCIQSTDMVQWTREVELAIAEHTLPHYHTHYHEQILRMVNVIKQPLDSLQRTLVCTLIVVDVHNRDIVQHLVEQEVEGAEDFEWQRQLRYYWESDESHTLGNTTNMNDKYHSVKSTSMVGHTMNIGISHGNAHLWYGYEYIGNQPRLVITPLTDRAFLTCTSALAMNLGAAPQGPAGTGKTESVKDLGKALARPVVVFNCSEGINYKTMSRMFAGLAQAGAWACFDEFNRIELEVLSVIAQQMLEITTALAQRQERMIFDGHSIRLSTNFGVFITMNPGYAGRTELPDNLKALFRPICMMIPDYALIAEIMFYSEGFANARTLAHKMVQLYKLSSEQLSKQDHYDFGMRAVKSILVMAGALKRQNPEESEDMLLIRAMRDSNVPKFLRDDTVLFMALVRDLFPTIHIEDNPNALLSQYLRETMLHFGLQVVDGMMIKALQLYDTLVVRHGLMLVGQTLTGKTTITRTMQTALSSICNDGHNANNTNPFFNKVEVHLLNPKSVTMGELYGQVNEITREWTDGILSDIARRVTRSALSVPDRQWIIFDGPVDAVWIENMNTVLDDNKLLCLFNGERIKLPSTATFMFEVQDLAVASPATVSRCGMVFLEPYYLDQHRGWRPIAQSLTSTKAHANRYMRSDRLMTLLESFLPTTLDFVREHCKEWIPSVDAQLAINCIEMLDAMLRSCDDDDDYNDDHYNKSNVKSEQQDGHRELHHKRASYELNSEEGAMKATQQQKQSVWPIDAIRPIEAANTESAEEMQNSVMGKETLDLLHSRKSFMSNSKNSSRKASVLFGNANQPRRSLVRPRRSTVSQNSTTTYEVPNEFHQLPISFATVASDAKKLFDMYFVMSLVWSVGGNLRDDSRAAFSNFLRNLLTTQLPELTCLPQEISLYDYVVHRPSLRFITWQHLVPTPILSKQLPYFELVVPTPESVALQTMLGILTSTAQHVLVNGVTGTGKSININAFMRENLNGDDATSSWEYFTTVLSAQTRSKDIEARLESKLFKVRNNVLGPTPGKRVVFFVDDLNMPSLEKYGASPPLELLRQILTQHGYYDKHKTPAFFKEVHDLVVLAACGVPGGGRNAMTARLTSRFHLLCQPAVSSESIRRIFGTILYGFLYDWHSEEITQLAMKLVTATKECYDRISQEKLPTPTRSHYTFNLRDYSKVIQGMMQCSPRAIDSVDGLHKLFIHEVSRVFHDRLIDENDRSWWWKTLEEVCTNTLNMEWNSTLPQTLFGSYMRRDHALYEEINDEDRVQSIFNEYQNAYNLEYNKESKLVLFHDAICHISRICRILRQPRGNALIVGMGGTGRQSLCKLAAFICNLPIYEVVITRMFTMDSFHETLKRVLLDCGCHDKDGLLYLSDAQIVFEEMLEDINNLLNSGEVPNLMEVEDVDAIVDAVRPMATAAGKLETRNVIFAHFVALCRDKVHVVLTMSPVGDQFRRRLRMFPSLVNCCTIDWFDQWPADALASVAERVLANVQLDRNINVAINSSSNNKNVHGNVDQQTGGGDNNLAKGSLSSRLVELCVFIHLDVQARSAEFYDELRRRNYTTPTSYLELLTCYCNLLATQDKLVTSQIERYQGGLRTLQSTQRTVDEMKEKLIMLQPKLIQAAAETEEIMAKVKEEQATAEQVRQKCAKEEAVASGIQAEADAIRADCQVELNKALPILKAAEDALAELRPDDIREVRSFQKPAARVVLVLEAVLTLLGEKDVSWERSKLVMSRMDFIKDLQNYKRDELTEKMIRSIQKYVNNADFRPEEVEKSSKACKTLAIWVLAINNYYEVVKVVAPKRAKLAEAEAKVAIATQALNEAQSYLRDIENKLAALHAQMDENARKKKQLEDDIALTKVRLQRAEQLMSGLSSEQTRWMASIVKLQSERANHVGTMALAAGFIAYLAPFTAPYRKRMLEAWHDRCVELHIPVQDATAHIAQIHSELENTENKVQQEHQSQHGNGHAGQNENASSSAFTSNEHLSNTNENNHSVEFDLTTITDPVKVRSWAQQGLPPDSFSVENGVVVTTSQRWCLCIDPQGQAVNWIRAMESSNNLRVVKLTEPNYMRTLENAIRVGLPVLIENVEEQLDAVLDPVLLRQTFRSQGRLLIKLGDNEIDYDPKFKLYLTTKLANPHYLPELQIKVTIVNFTVTHSGLEDQLLADVVRHEYAELEERATQTVLDIARGKGELQEVEDKILHLLSSSTGNILDNEQLVNALQGAKATSEAVTKALELAEHTQCDINIARNRYRPVATRGATIYAVISELAGLDHMYQISLEFFKLLFVQTLERTPRVSDVVERVRLLLPAVTLNAYNTICRGLFEKDKLTFAFLLYAHIARERGGIRDAEWSFLLKGSEGRRFVDDEVDPPPIWLPSSAWNEVAALSSLLPQLCAVKDDLYDHESEWESWYSDDAHNAHKEYPSILSTASLWHKVLVLKALREDLLQKGIVELITETLGAAFTESPAFDLDGCFADSSPIAPIIFVLTSGTDPTVLFSEFAERKGFDRRKLMLSLGQDQGVKAEAMINQAQKEGLWVYLQNCHVYTSWMSSLEQIVERFAHAELHKDFRLWLTTMPTRSFPVLLLQSGVKVVNEPPRGLKANLRNTFTLSISDDIWNGMDNADMYKEWNTRRSIASDDHSVMTPLMIWRRLLCALAFFHGVIQERRKFGPLGWNIPYEWNASDFTASLQSLVTYVKFGNTPQRSTHDNDNVNVDVNNFINNTESLSLNTTSNNCAEYVPWNALEYMIGVINYGGRVTDFLDQRCMMTLLGHYFTSHSVENSSEYHFTHDGCYGIPAHVNLLDDIREYVSNLPSLEAPEVFGLHANADIAYNKNTVRQQLSAILSVQPRAKTTSGGSNPEESVMANITEFQRRLPPLIDKSKAHPDTYRVKAEDGIMISLGTVVSQEIDVFNRLIEKLERTLVQLQRGVKGEVVMSAELEQMFDSMLLGQVPQCWHDGGYLSRKPLASWFEDTLQRVEFFRDWNNNGMPLSFWLSGFYFPQGFLTGVLQTFSRQHTIPIDEVKFKTNVTRYELPDDVEEEVENGVYIHGLFLEGAGFDSTRRCLTESKKGELYTSMPVIHLEPTRQQSHANLQNTKTSKNDNNKGNTAADGNDRSDVSRHQAVTEQTDVEETYACPVYKTSARVGVLSTTGLSTNYVISLDLRCGSTETDAKHWVKRGVAMLCMLDD